MKKKMKRGKGREKREGGKKGRETKGVVIKAKKGGFKRERHKRVE